MNKYTHLTYLSSELCSKAKGINVPTPPAFARNLDDDGDEDEDEDDGEGTNKDGEGEDEEEEDEEMTMKPGADSATMDANL